MIFNDVFLEDFLKEAFRRIDEMCASVQMKEINLEEEQTRKRMLEKNSKTAKMKRKRVFS